MKRMYLFLVALLLVLLVCGGVGAETAGDYEYSVNGDGTATITRYRGSETELEIPEELNGFKVTDIGDSAFFGRGLASITIPNSVTSIGDYAFHWCSLMSVRIPDSVTNIGKNPFIGCMDLAEIQVSPEHPCLTTIDGVLFSKPDRRLVCYPSALTATAYCIPNEIAIIGDSAFSWCFHLSSVEISDSVTCIENSAFIGCSHLAEIHVSPEHPYLTTIDGVLFSKPDKRLVCYPSAFIATAYSIPDGIRDIGAGAFFGCDNLTSITIPDSVTCIGDSAFVSCDKLRSVTIPDSVTRIEDYAFYYCCGLTSMTLPDSVASIGNYAFSICENLTSITIPDSVTNIGYGAFAACADTLTITVPRDSYAAQYCKENSLNYTYPDALDWLNN